MSTPPANDMLPAPAVHARKQMLSIIGICEVARKLGFGINETKEDQPRRDLLTVIGMELEHIVHRLRVGESVVQFQHAVYLSDAEMARALAEIVECGRDLGYSALIPMAESRVTKIAGVVAGLERVLLHIWGVSTHPEPEAEAIAA